MSGYLQFGVRRCRDTFVHVRACRIIVVRDRTCPPYGYLPFEYRQHQSLCFDLTALSLLHFVVFYTLPVLSPHHVPAISYLDEHKSPISSHEYKPVLFISHMQIAHEKLVSILFSTWNCNADSMKPFETIWLPREAVRAPRTELMVSPSPKVKEGINKQFASNSLVLANASILLLHPNCPLRD
jgi:hypothetical protein